MQSAMVIMGHERRFHEEGRALADFLRRECRQRYVAEVDGWCRSPRDMQTVISFHAARAGRQPFLLAYLGHGWHDGWYYGQEYRRKWLMLTYDWLEKLLKTREGPTLILNDTCHSGSLNQRMRQWREPNETAVIAATSPRGSAVGQLTPDVIRSWRNGDTYLPRRRTLMNGRAYWERRAGVAHDRFFFARPA